jgi:dTDP-D-glucose 4,6-dehydratase
MQPGWQIGHSYDQGLTAPVAWYLEQLRWCQRVREKSG